MRCWPTPTCANGWRSPAPPPRPVAGRPLRQPGRRAPAEGAAAGRRSRRLRRLLARRAGGRRRAPQVRRADPDRPQPCLRPPRRSGPADHLVIDAPTRASLELLRSHLRRRGTASLLAAIDRTVTGPGARELAARLASPLRDAGSDRRAARRGRLPARATSRCARTRARAARPRPTSPAPCRGWPCSAAARATSRAVRDGLACGARVRAPAARDAEAASACRTRSARIARRLTALRRASLQPLLARALVDDPPHLRARRRLRARRASAPTSTRRARLRDDSRKVMAALEARYVEETGIKALKVRHNNILGYYIEVPAGAAKPLLTAAAHRTPSATARPWPARCASPPPSWSTPRAASSPPPSGRWPSSRRSSPSLPPPSPREEQALGELAAALAELDCEAAPRRISPPSRATRGPCSTTAPPSRSAAAAIRWSSRR